MVARKIALIENGKLPDKYWMGIGNRLLVLEKESHLQCVLYQCEAIEQSVDERELFAVAPIEKEPTPLDALQPARDSLPVEHVDCCCCCKFILIQIYFSVDKAPSI